MGCEMILVEEEATRLREYFERRRKPMPESNLKQAMFPPEAVIVKNEMGSAPGMYLNKGGKTIVLLPGPPREMMPMFVKEIGPLLVRDVGPAADRVLMRCIKVIGPGESQVDEMLAEIIKEPRGCSLALLAKEGEVHIKVTAEGENRAGSQKILDEVCCRITDKMGDYVFTDNEEDDLVTVTAKLLLNRNETVAVAESCTGGLLSKMLTDVAGSSRYFWGSVTSYSNEAKELFLGVKKATLEKHGAVSRETAAEMARGIREKAQSTYGIGITGIAGPDGGSADKPVGLVYIALADARNCRVKEMHFAGGRDGVRMLSAKTALDFLRKSISGVK